MDNPKKFRRFIHLLATAGILFLFLLIGFQSVPVIGGSEALYIQQASLQGTRSQSLARAALVLEYRSASERAQAISDMQTILPLFEQEQAFLLTSRDLNVQWLLQGARPDYLALIGAVGVILAHTAGPVDPVQVNVVLAHDKLYLYTISQLMLVLQQHADAQVWQLFLIESAIELVLLVIAGIFLVFVNRVLIKMVQVYSARGTV